VFVIRIYRHGATRFARSGSESRSSPMTSSTDNLRTLVQTGERRVLRSSRRRNRRRSVQNLTSAAAAAALQAAVSRAAAAAVSRPISFTAGLIRHRLLSCLFLAVALTAHCQGCKKPPKPGGVFMGLLDFWVVRFFGFFRLGRCFCENTHLDGFWNFYGLSVG